MEGEKEEGGGGKRPDRRGPQFSTTRNKIPLKGKGGKEEKKGRNQFYRGLIIVLIDLFSATRCALLQKTVSGDLPSVLREQGKKKKKEGTALRRVCVCQLVYQPPLRSLSAVVRGREGRKWKEKGGIESPPPNFCLLSILRRESEPDRKRDGGGRGEKERRKGGERAPQHNNGGDLHLYLSPKNPVEARTWTCVLSPAISGRRRREYS